ncbi:MAG: hypothetical protein EBV06_10135 [Planctomycetia bacterium]|nr:hypothetical protein [Planctomycetia bacterium]
MSALAMLLMTFAFPGQAEPNKMHKLAVAFQVPSSAHKASITEVRIVDKELWVRVDVMGGGIGLAVISTAKAEATVEAPALPIKYLVFGKTWKWQGDEKGLIFLADLSEKEQAEREKQYAAGKVVYTAAKKK